MSDLRGWFLSIVFLSLSVSAATVEGKGALRTEISLNGTWDYLTPPAAGAALPDAKAAGWTRVAVPHWEIMARAWYRRTISVPAAMKDGRVEIYFHGVGVRSRLYVNGTAAGENVLTVTPWVVDITDKLAFGKDNELMLGVESGNVAVSAGGKPPWSVPGIWWTRGTTCGIFYEVELRSHPQVYVHDVFVQPSFRHKKLKVTFCVTNTSGRAAALTVANRVLGADNQTAIALGDVPLTVEPGQTRMVTAEKEWPNPRCWWPHDPYLYHLETRLQAAGQPVDVLRTRFGFREVWVEKTYLVFNGVRAPVRRTSEGLCWIRYDREGIQNYLWERRRWGINNVRWHSLPASEYLLDLADEQGMLITQEGDMWMDQGHYTLDDLFWQRFGTHWEAIAKLSRNHPCVLSYSIANESFSMEKGVWRNPQSEFYRRFHRVNQIVRRTDPATLIEYASGDDCCGDTAVRNWHYPNNLSARWNAPNDFFWLASHPHVGSTETAGHRTKPVIVGEDYYDGFRGPIGGYAAYGGEAYYLAGPKYRESPTFLEVNKLKTDAYRLSGITVVNPADPCVRHCANRIIPPVAILARDFRQDFFSGETVHLRYGLANEQWFAQPLEMKWRLVSADDNQTIKDGSQRYDMVAGTIRDVTIEFAAPAVERRRNYVLQTTVQAGGKIVDENEHLIHVFPNRSLVSPAGVRIGLCDPSRTTAAKWRKLGLTVKPVDTINASALRDLDVFVFGPENARWQGLGAGAVRDLLAFVRRGGNLLVLEQSAPGPKDLIGPLHFDPAPATMAFIRRPDHPVLRGIEPTDLRWWGRDHWVTSGVWLKSRTGNARILVETADPLGLRWTPLLEVRGGAGRMVYCALRVGEKAPESPVARLLLQNLLTYLSSKPGPAARVGILAADGSKLAGTLADMKLAGANRIDLKMDLGRFGLIIADAGELASPEMRARVKQFVHNGGTLLLKALAPGQASVVEDLTGTRPVITAANPYQCVRCSDDPLVSGIGQFELWWRAGDWVENTDGTQAVLPICRSVLSNWPGAKVHIVALPAWLEWTAARATELKITAMALAERPVGKGRVIVDQINWNDPGANPIGRPYAAALLSNLGADFGGEDTAPVADRPAGSFQPLSLHGLVNQGLNDEVGIRTASGEGLNNLARVPTGPRVPLDGIPFDISGIITLGSPAHAPGFPERVNGLPCKMKARRLHFLHGCGWGAGKGNGVLTYVINYADNTTAAVDVQDEVHVMNWWMAALPLSGAKLAWEGKNEVHTPICLYRMAWTNPKPGVEISHIDFVSAGSTAVPFVVGVTVERP